MLQITESIAIPMDEIEFTYSRSSGPGGQHVNKVNTKATLRWDIGATSALPEDVRQRALDRYASRISKEGHFLITSQRHRERERNTEDCLEKLRALLAAVVAVPKPRRKTKPSKASKQRRLQEKKRQSNKKEMRRRPGMDD